MVLEGAAKFPKRLNGTKIGEKITNVVWAVTARMIITSQNSMFYTMLWCFPNFIREIAPNWIALDGIRDVHWRIHMFAGVCLMVIPSLVHVLVISSPPLIDGTKLKCYPKSTFNHRKYPDYQNWSEFWDPAAVQSRTFTDLSCVHLTADKIYLFMIDIIVIFCILSLLLWAGRITQTIEAILWQWPCTSLLKSGTLMTTFERSPMVTNLPIVVLWCFDRLLSLWIYRYLHRRIVCKEGIGGEGGEEGKKHGDPGRNRNSANQWAK